MASASSLPPLLSFLCCLLVLFAVLVEAETAASLSSSSLLSPPSFALFTAPAQPPLRAVLYVPSSPSTSPPPAMADLYSFTHRALHHRDLPLLSAMGANTVFLSPHAWHETTSHSHFLSLCVQHNLSVAVPFLPSFPFPPSAYDVTDRRAAALQAVEDRWRSVLRQYQSHPAVILWIIADTPPFASSSPSPASGPSPTAAHLQLCRRLMAARDAECRHRPAECHPLTSAFGDSPPSHFVTDPLSYLHSLSPPLDLYSLAYSQPVSALPSFLTAFLRHQRSHAASPSLSPHRPLLLLLSADAYDSRSASRNESMQSAHLLRLLRTLARYERKVLVGVLLADWLDQWWRSDGFDRPRVDCMRGEDSRGEEAARALRERRRREGNNEQEVCGWETLRGRRGDDEEDGFMSVAYAGITAHSLSSPHLCIVPQLAYFSLRSLWTDSALLTAREREGWCQHSAACCAVDANSQGWILVAVMMAAILLLLAAHRCWRQRTDEAEASRWAAVDGGQDRAPAVYVRPAALSDKLVGALYERLLASPSASLASLPHLRLVHSLMTHLLSQALTRTATLSQALSVVHARTLASYRAWCCSLRLQPALSADCASPVPSASSLLSDVCDYLLLWASCEQLRRVPAFVCFAFHHRSSLDLPALLTASTAAIEGYQQSYDDVDAAYLSPPASASPSSLLSLPSRLWSNRLQAFAYPLLGGWSALLHLLWPLLSFHVLLYLLLIATAREEDRVDEGLLDIAYHLQGERGRDTLRLLVIADAAMLCVYQLLDAMVTATFRLRSAVILIVGLKSCSLLSALSVFSLLAPVDRLLRLLPMPPLPVSFVTLYLTVRLLLILGLSLVRLFTRDIRTALPGALHRFVQLSPSAFDSLPVAAGGAGAAVSAATASSAVAEPVNPPRDRRRSCLKRAGQSVWLQLRLLSFWLLVLTVKLLFDLYVLIPAVSRLTLSSLCLQPDPPLRSALSSTSSLALSVSSSLACPLFLLSLQGITLLISIATSYISYVIITSIVGVFVPALLASTVKQERAVMAAVMMAASTGAVVTIAVGGLSVVLLTGAALTCMALLASEVWRGKGGWQECRQIVLTAGSRHQQAAAEAEETGNRKVEETAERRIDAERRRQREREERKEHQEPRREEAKEEQQAMERKTVVASAPSVSRLTTAPTLLDMRCLLQPLFAHRLSLRDAAATWSAILLHLHNEDLLPLHHLSASSPFSLSSSAFLSAPSLSQVLPAVRERLLFFFRSLLDLRRMAQGRLHRVEAVDSVSVIVPINSEAVLYAVEELLADERARDHRAAAARRADAGISLLEFYVQKHRDEWDNLAERVGFTAAAASRCGSSSPPQSDSSQRSANGDALLDAFILLHSGSASATSCQFTLSSFARYTEAVVLWTSYRGQTLARTVRGLSYTLTALQHRASVSPSLSSSFQCEDKFQLLVAAQQYGRDARQRQEMGRLMRLFPHLELVYDLDVRAWQRERIRNRGKDRAGSGESESEAELLGALAKQRLPGLNCVPAEERKDIVDDAEVRKRERQRASALMQSSVQHLSVHLPLVLSAVQAVSAAAAGDVNEEEKKQRWEEKEAATGDASILAAAVSASVLSLPALLHADDVSAVVWADVLQEVELQLHAMQQLELRLCQQELLSPSTQHALAASNCLHFLHLHQHALQQHSRVLALLARYRSGMLRLLTMWRQVRADAAVLETVKADWRRVEHESRRVLEIMQAGTAMPQTGRGDNAGRAVLQLDAGLRRLSAGRQRHIAVCERQRQVVLSVMQSMQTMLETEHEDTTAVAAAASPAFTLSTLAQLSGQLLAFSIAMEQFREAQQQHHAVLFLLHALCSLPPLLQVEQQRLLHWLHSCTDVAQAMGGAPLSASYAVAVSELQQRQLELSSQLSKLHSLHSEGLRSLKLWMRANQRQTEQPCSLPPPLPPTPQLASYSPLLPALFSLYLSILHSHFLSSVSAACRLLLQLTAESPVSASLSLQPVFSSLRAGTLFITQQAVRAICCWQREENGDEERQREVEERRLQPLVSAAQSAYLQLVIFPFQSVHIKHDAASASAFRPLVLQSLPRRSALLLGSLPASCPSSFPAPCTNPKSENQLHALPFARHALWQSIDMNQDLAFEDALKAPLFFASLQPSSPHSVPRFVLAGCSERIYSSSISAVGRFMGLQDSSFTSICQRVLSYTDTRLHYGHPDVFDAYHARSRVGMSKASPSLNLSEDLYFGLDMMQTGAASAYLPFIRYAKGREVSLFNAATFEDKLSRGAALTLSSPDLYRLRAQLDLLSWLSLLLGAMGHYLFTFLFSHGISVFVWLTLLQAVARITSEKIGLLHSVYAIPFLFHLGFAFGLPLLCQLVWEDGLWTGGRRWLSNLLLGSVYYLFQLRVKARGLEVGLGGGSGGYVSTGRGLCLYPPSLITLYTAYASSHFHHALHLLLLTSVFLLFLSSEAASAALLRLWAVLLACWSWLLAPALFAPSMQGEEEETSRESVGRRLWKEWEELREWLRAGAEAGGDGGDEASWERWWWREKRQTLLQHGLRFHTTAPCGWRRYVHHPHCHAVRSLLFCLLSHTPRLLLAFAMMMPAMDLLPLFALSAAFVASVTALCRAQHVLPVLLILLFAYSALLTLSSLHSREGWTLPAASLIPSHRLLHTLMLTAALLISSTSFSSLAIAVLDARAVLRVHRGQTLSSAPLPAEYAAVVRDWRLFAVWRLVYRYACPSIIAALHLVCRYVCCCCCDLHSWWLYELDMSAVREARRRRRRQRGQTASDGAVSTGA